VDDQALLRYSRHILLDELGIEGQTRIRQACALIIGAGGLGCPAALYLASAGIGHLIIADDDEVDLTNLQRQILHTTARVGWDKVESARQAIADINPDVEVTALKQRLDATALAHWVSKADVVLDCCDNFKTRHAVNRACIAQKKPLVSGAAIRFDGQLAVFDTRQADAPCYHCLFPEGDDVSEVRCATMGVFAPLTGVIGTLQAAEALKVISGAGQTLTGGLLLFDARSSEFQRIRVKRDPGCAACADR
jgi:adenylyltransferase/sulfurtransferase